MRTDLDHLPHGKQRELARVIETLFEEFTDAMKGASSPKKKEGRILKIVLFGSYARGTWVDEPHTAKGYLSDYDLLIVVNQQSVVDFATYWYRAEDRIMRDAGIKTPVNFIVHTMDEVNSALSEGQYFFTDIIKEGIELYDLKGSTPFITPQPLTAEEAGPQLRSILRRGWKAYEARCKLLPSPKSKASIEMHPSCCTRQSSDYTPACSL
jgi:predicted nucleotidyltransferase